MGFRHSCVYIRYVQDLKSKEFAKAARVLYFGREAGKDPAERQ